MVAGKAIDAILYLKELAEAYRQKNNMMRRALYIISQKSPDKDIKDYAEAILKKESNISLPERHSS